MTYSNAPQPNPYAHVPSPLPNIDFPTPYWINKLKDLIIIGCLDPDLVYAALLVPAAAKMFWEVATPSTKQIIEGATGRSWICGTKQVMSQANQGEELARSSSGQFVYGALKGLDIAAYYAFMVSTGAKGVIDFASFAAQFQRVCHGTPSLYRGLTPDGGWPVPVDAWQAGPAFLNAHGDLIGDLLVIHEGEIGAFIVWCSFSNFEGTGGVVVSLRLRDEDTNEIYAIDTVDNTFSVSQKAIVQFFTTEGRADRDIRIVSEIRCTESVTERMVPYQGGCFKRNWQPTASDAPPYWNMRTMLKSKAPPP